MGKGAAKKADAASQAQMAVAKKQISLAENEQKLGKEVWEQTKPVREYATNTYMGMAKGNVPGIEKYTAPQINAATQQFTMARKQAESMPPGAARDAAMREINLQQAGTNTSIYSGGAQDALQRTASMGWGGVGMTTGMLGQSGQGLAGGAGSYGGAAQNYANVSASQAGAWGSLGGGLGGIAGGLLGKKG